MLSEDVTAMSDNEIKHVFESSLGISNGPSRQVVRLKFTPFRARWVAHELWHLEQFSVLLPEATQVLVGTRFRVSDVMSPKVEDQADVAGDGKYVS